MDALPKDINRPEATLASQGIQYCNKLFEIENELKNLSAAERNQQPLKLEKTILEAFWSWVDSTRPKVLPKSKLGEALTYASNQKEGLMNYLKDGNCVISNNLAENSIRPFTIGRKN